MQITTEQLKALISDNLRDNNHKAEILKQFDLMNNQINFFDTELRRYYGEVDNMKEALFHRNELIQGLDQEVQELTEKNETLEREYNELKIKYNECVRNTINYLLKSSN